MNSRGSPRYLPPRPGCRQGRHQCVAGLRVELRVAPLDHREVPIALHISTAGYTVGGAVLPFLGCGDRCRRDRSSRTQPSREVLVELREARSSERLPHSWHAASMDPLGPASADRPARKCSDPRKKSPTSARRDPPRCPLARGDRARGAVALRQQLPNVVLAARHRRARHSRDADWFPHVADPARSCPLRAGRRPPGPLHVQSGQLPPRPAEDQFRDPLLVSAGIDQGPGLM